jgi:hypothetical protein
VLAAALAALAVACADPVPAAPTWVDDVEPILRGNCFGCHGARPAHQDAARWDFYDRGDPRLADVGDFSAHLISGRDPAHFVAIQAYVAPRMEEGRRMPPPPALRLSERDLAVLDAWRAAGFPRGTRPYNRPPSVTWWPAPPRLLVRDDDQEQVLGKLTCHGGRLLLPRSGSFDLPADLQPPCSALLFDGQDLVSVSPVP